MDWKNLISSVAPFLGTALGGPLGGMAVSAIGDALGLSDKSESAIKQALSGITPEQMLAVKNADQAFQLKMQELGFASLKDMEQIAESDRDSARKREIEVKDNTPKILAYFITLGFFAILAFMMFYAVPAASKDVLNILLGSLGTAWIAIVSYYFGSSNGSDRKTELIAQAPAIEK